MSRRGLALTLAASHRRSKGLQQVCAMPTTLAQFFSYELRVLARAGVLVPEMSRVVAVDASGDDVVSAVWASVTSWNEMLRSASEPLSLRTLNLSGSAERFEIVFPHRQAAVVAAAQLGEVCVVTTAG